MDNSTPSAPSASIAKSVSYQGQSGTAVSVSGTLAKETTTGHFILIPSVDGAVTGSVSVSDTLPSYAGLSYGTPGVTAVNSAVSQKGVAPLEGLIKLPLE